jgi:thiol-disulfide isomerase/thioredoxin
MVNGLSQGNYLYALNNKMPFAVLLLPNTISEEHLDIMVKELLVSAEKLRGEMFFMYGNFSDQYQTTIAIDFEVEEKHLPVVLIQDFNKETKLLRRYKLTNIDLNQEATSKTITAFFDSFKGKTLRRFLKSDKSIGDPYNAQDNYYNLVRRNFKDILTTVHADEFAMVYFVRKNCGPCNEYLKDFLAIAAKNKGAKNVLFAIVDGLSNEFDEFEIPGFPSVLLFKPG